ncbi:MAG: Ycf66 family protein [Geitlerinemataceae cyanobacterium]
MLSYILATIVGLGSVAFYMAAFFFPEVYRKGDFVWSGVGFFYALVLWFCAGQIGGAVLLGQTASVALVAWLGWQTLILRRETTPLAEQTSTAAIDRQGISPTAIGEKVTNVFKPGNKATTQTAASSVLEMATDAIETVSDAVAEGLETATEFLETKAAEENLQPTAPLEDITDLPSTAISKESPEGISPVIPEPENIAEEISEDTPKSSVTDIEQSTPIVATEDDFEDELDAVTSAPTPAPAPSPSPPTPSVQPKSRTFGFLASLTNRLKGLLSKEKPKSPTPVQTTPSSIAQPDKVMDSVEVETAPPTETLEVVDSEEVETVTSTETIEIIEVMDSEDVEIVEVVDSEKVETVTFTETIEVVDSEDVETVTPTETSSIPVPEEAETIVSEENPADSAILPKKEEPDLDKEMPNSDETSPTSKKPKPKKKQS